MVGHVLFVDQQRADISAALGEAKKLGVVSAATEASRTLGLARPRKFGFIGFHSLASTTHGANRTGRARVYGEANTVAKVPRGFHAAANGPLKLAGGDAVLGRAKQVDRLKPQGTTWVESPVGTPEDKR